VSVAIRGDDLIQPFQLNGVDVRGRLVRLGAVVDEIHRRHGYPEAVAGLLGEALALTALLAGTLKFDGSFTLQTKSDGPVPMMVTDYRTGGELRGYASVDQAALAATGDARLDAGRLLGRGHIAFTVDQGEDTERYQGIVELAGTTLADCAHAYFRQSEQLQASFALACGRRPAGPWRAGGLMLQRLPDRGQSADDAARDENWVRAVSLLATLTGAELVDRGLTAPELLYRLFHEDGVWLTQVQSLVVGCRCDANRVERILKSFGPEEIRDMAEDGVVTATCEFCNISFPFAATDLIAGAAE